MAQVSDLAQVLAQTPAVERVQEGARRRGEVEQHQAARQLADSVEIHGRQVEGSPEPHDPRIEPDEEGGGEQHPPQEKQAHGRPQTAEESVPATDEKGRVIDLSA